MVAAEKPRKSGSAGTNPARKTRKKVFAVLDQDLYAIPASAIGDTSVALTIASGQVMHGDE